MEKSKKNTKKIIGTIVDVIIWILVIACVGVSIVAVSAADEEIIRQKAIEEYLKKQQETKENSEENTNEEIKF